MIHHQGHVYIACNDVILLFEQSYEGDLMALEVDLSADQYQEKEVARVAFAKSYQRGLWLKPLLTNDEKHAILVPDKSPGDQYSKHYRYDFIVILDILDDGRYELRKSTVDLPPHLEGDFVYRTAILSGGGIYHKLLTIGFARRALKKSDFIFPCTEIIDLIIAFCNKEALHVFNARYHNDPTSMHWIIDASIVIS